MNTRIIKAALMLTAGLAGAALLLSACKPVENREYVFEDIDQARDAIARGWVPEELPSSAKKIVVRYNLDTNERIVRWYGPPLLAECHEISGSDLSILERAPKSVQAEPQRCIDGYADQSRDRKVYWAPGT